jgi:hypothetical protein
LFFVFVVSERDFGGDEIPWTHRHVSETNKATMTVVMGRRMAIVYCFVLYGCIYCFALCVVPMNLMNAFLVKLQPQKKPVAIYCESGKQRVALDGFSGQATRDIPKGVVPNNNH